MEEKVTRGRFAPTPSGRMHAGNIMAALLAWLSCRSEGGTMVLRIEDLDPRAQDRKNAELLMDDLSWLGLDWDEGPFYQSDRRDIYREAIAELRERGLTYPCFCTRAELHAATAPHASDGTYIYQGTCRHLTKEEVARKSAERRPATSQRNDFIHGCCLWTAVRGPCPRLRRFPDRALGRRPCLPACSRRRRCPDGRHGSRTRP